MANEIHAVMQDTTNIHQVVADQPENDDMPRSADLAFRCLGTRSTEHERVDEYAGAEIGPMAGTGPFRVLADVL